MSTYYAYKCKTCRPEPTFEVLDYQWVVLVDPTQTDCDLYLTKPISELYPISDPKSDQSFEYVGVFQGEPRQLIINRY